MQEVVLITGAAKRIGRHLAKTLAANGFAIALHYGHSEQEAWEVRQEIVSSGGYCQLIQADLGDANAVDEIFTQIENSNLKVRYLIHNASLFKNITFEEMSAEDWNRHIQVNLTSPVLLNQAFAKQLGKNTDGKIIHLLDWRALRPGADHFPYTISKAALASVTKSLALALAPRIQVNGIAFGAILPPADGGETTKLIQSIPAQRWATLEEVGNTVLFLIQGPDYITGEIIHLDGGRHLV